MTFLDLLPRPAWHRDAACRGAGPDIFYPAAEADTGLARDICRGCPVVPECAAWASDHNEPDGVWAGQWRRQGRIVAA